MSHKKDRQKLHNIEQADEIFKLTPSVGTGKSSRTPSNVDQIQFRAFEISRDRNGGPGDPLSDWLQAERELSETTAGGSKRTNSD